LIDTPLSESKAEISHHFGSKHRKKEIETPLTKRLRAAPIQKSDKRSLGRKQYFRTTETEDEEMVLYRSLQSSKKK